MIKNNPDGVRTWIEVDIKALQSNYQTFRSLIDKKCKLMAVSKSNAYGHGLVDYSKEMEKLGCDFIGVDSITEALTLRKEGIKRPILVLGYTLPEMVLDAANNDISLTISSFENIEIMRQVHDGMKVNLKIHIKVDTGMHRQGFFVEELEEVLKAIKPLRQIEIEGIYTHFAAAKNPAFPADTKKQIEGFEKACSIFKSAGYDKIIRHAAATSGAIVFPESHFDMVRIGIGLYGLWPSVETESAFKERINLAPALSWKTIISEVKTIKKGERIGYGLTETLWHDAKIAILPIGYWHGLRWTLSSVGHAIIGGKKVKFLGRVCMDMAIVDVTSIPDIKIGDEAVLIGKQKNEDIVVDELASLAGSYNYEVITQLNPLIKRVYV